MLGDVVLEVIHCMAVVVWVVYRVIIWLFGWSWESLSSSRSTLYGSVYSVYGLNGFNCFCMVYDLL